MLMLMHIKTAHWEQLPWKLCVAGHHDAEVARAGLRACRTLYREAAVSCPCQYDIGSVCFVMKVLLELACFPGLFGLSRFCLFRYESTLRTVTVTVLVSRTIWFISVLSVSL